MYLRCSRRKMIFRLLCKVFFLWLPNLYEKQVVELAVVCVKALVHLEMSTNLCVEMCVLCSCFILYSWFISAKFCWSGLPKADPML